jgi:predicted nucleic acid-binding protein
VITYLDTSILLKLLVADESYQQESERLWLDSDYVVCAEIGYVEARAALAAARRHGRLISAALRTATEQFELLWEKVSIVVIDTALVRAAGDVAERDGLRGYDAVHLAAAITAQATVLASADRDLVEAARRRGFGVAQLF